ncbi:peptidase M4 family protein, partial [Streptomyces sp. NPDC057705]
MTLPTSSSPTPRSRTRVLRAAAVVASAAMVAISVQSGSANASAEREAGATALALTADARVQAITAAQDTAADTARAIGLADDERLVARDVIKDADGTVHTRYERTYSGMPVLGGDLVVHQKKN